MPIELLRQIISHLYAFDFPTRQATLLALSSSCRVLLLVAQPYLYTRPRDLASLQRQQRFRSTLAAKPHLARHIESLQLLWLPSGDKSDLLIEIVRDCVNPKHLLIHRRGNGDETNPPQITKKRATDLATLVATCPCLTSFIYKTLVGWAGPGQLEGDEEVVNGSVRDQSFTKNLKYALFVSTTRKLSELALYEQSEWVARALLPNVSAKLERLDLGQDVNLSFDKNILNNLSRQCPSLQTLNVRCNVRLVDPIQACKAWGSSLRILRIASVEDEEGESAQLPPSWLKMEALEELSLGPAPLHLKH